MEERFKKSGGFSDDENLLVDQEFADFIQQKYRDYAIDVHPFDDGASVGYIRYTVQNKSLIIIDCVITGTK
jgi:hypothetical protein